MKKSQNVIALLFILSMIASFFGVNKNLIHAEISSKKEIKSQDVTSQAEIIDAIASFENSSVSLELNLLNDVEITETIYIRGDVNITSEGKKLYRSDNFKGQLLLIKKGASLSLQGNISLDGRNLRVDNKSLSYDNATAIEVYGNLLIDGATVENHIGQISSAIVGKDDSRIIMNDGIIKHNESQNGFILDNASGAIKLFDNSYFELNDGEISDNVGSIYAAGVSAIDNSTFIFNNGSILRNKTTHQNSIGGGIYIGISANFTMNGGLVDSNVAPNGGGIAIGTSSNKEGDKLGNHNLIAGKISNNIATDLFGGGLYIPSEIAQIHLNDVIVINNKAKYGGGLYDCPTGSTLTYISNGGALVNNIASGGGNLLYKYPANFDNSIYFHMSSRILGGGKQTLYLDFNNDRYQPSDNPINGKDYENYQETLFLHNEVTDESIDIAKDKAKLIIENNISEGAGGGIGNNGTLIIGNKDQEKTVKLIKKWNVTNEIPDEVMINVMAIDEKGNKHKIETVSLNDDNKWSSILEELPGEYTYSAEEESTNDYEVSYIVKVEGKTTEIEITNSDIELEEGSIVVKYVDEDGNDIAQIKEKSDKVGTEFNEEPLIIEGYNYKELHETSSNPKGQYTTETQTIIFVYTKKKEPVIPFEEGSIVVKYVDEDGNDIAQIKEKSDKVGTEFNEEPLIIEGYNYKELHETSSNPKGQYTTETQTIIFVYTKEKEPVIPFEEGSIVVKYVDEDGNDIAQIKEKSDKIGTQYNEEPLIIEGYNYKELHETSSNPKGQYTTETQTIIFVYRKNSLPLKNIDPNDPTKPFEQINPLLPQTGMSGSYLGLFSLLLGASLIVLKLIVNKNKIINKQ